MKFSNLKNKPVITRSLEPVVNRKINDILTGITIDIFDQNENWEGTAQLNGIELVKSELINLFKKESDQVSKRIIEQCLEHIYRGEIKSLQNSLDKINESAEPEYWEESDLGLDTASVEAIFSQLGIILYDLDIEESKITAYIDCPSSNLGYETVEALMSTTERLKKLEQKAEQLGFLMKINPDPFISGKMCITLQQ